MPPPHFPAWLTAVSMASLTIAVVCAASIALDETRRPQKMWIMNLVWPLAALFGGLAWLSFYIAHGRVTVPMGTTAGESAKTIPTSMPVAVAKGASHCGAGCVLGDIIAEGLASGHPSVLSTLGLTAIFPERLFAQWALDYLAALFAGVAFQYFTLKRMRNLSIKDGLLEAFKADVASITCWQAGMYGFLAIAQFLWFRPLYGGLAQADSPEFWFVMQLAMICGFATAYPMNWLLVRTGVKERM